MQFIPEILLICLCITLYSIFLYAKDNFVLLRKNVTLEQLFNTAFLSFFMSIICARIFYVGEHLSLKYLNPLVFLLFPYFPGLSFAGGLLGCLVSLWYITKKKKLPFGNILDIFSLSIFIAVQIGMLILFIITVIVIKKMLFILFVGFGIGMLMYLLLSLILSKNGLKDGNTGLLSFAVMLFHQGLLHFFLRGGSSFFRFTPEDILLGLLAFFCIIRILWQENTQGVKKK